MINFISVKFSQFHGARIWICTANADLDPGKATSMRIRIQHTAWRYLLSTFEKNSTKKCEQNKKLNIIPRNMQALRFAKGEKHSELIISTKKKSNNGGHPFLSLSSTHLLPPRLRRWNPCPPLRNPSLGQPYPPWPRRTLPPPCPRPHTSGRRPAWRT
jgi:hypothetical protein